MDNLRTLVDSIVMPTGPCPDLRVGRLWRIALLFVGVGLLGLLLIAGWLEPDLRGLGTHQQLGLPPCTIQQVFAMRCPACGMTTAWSHFVRGNWWAAFHCNAGGLLLAVASTAAIPWLTATAIRGKWPWMRPTEPVVLMTCLAVVAVTLTDWLWRLAVQHFSWS